MDQRRHVDRAVRSLFLVGSALLGGAPMLAPEPSRAAQYFVDGLNGGEHAPGTAAAPFKYFWQGTQAAKPGDTVFVLPTIVYPHLSISVSGTAANPIVFAGAGLSPNLTRAVGDPSHFAMWVNANYVVVRDFDLTAPGTQSALHVAENHHHVTIANNIMHDSGGNGISTVGDDYVTIAHNVVYGNAKNTSNNVFGSGISTLGNIDIDAETGVKMRIDGNIVYANTNQPACQVPSCLATASDSDGNGIIVDDLRRTQRDHIPYRGRTLITNNLVFGNGGRGIHVFLSDHVTVTGNTAYWNNQDPYEGNYRPGEVEVLYSGDVAVTDNILLSDGGVGIGGGKHTGTHVPLSISYCNGSGSVTGRFNIGFSSQNNLTFFYGKQNTIPVIVSDNRIGDPMLVHPSLNPLTADFHLAAGSPAAGAADPGTSAPLDLSGAVRGVTPSIGALQ